MEAKGGNPLVNQMREKVEGLVGGPVSCPCCGGQDWNAPSDLVYVWGMPDSYDPDADVGGEESPGLALFRALILVCSKCAFVRWHYVVTE